MKFAYIFFFATFFGFVPLSHAQNRNAPNALSDKSSGLSVAQTSLASAELLGGFLAVKYKEINLAMENLNRDYQTKLAEFAEVRECLERAKKVQSEHDAMSAANRIYKEAHHRTTLAQGYAIEAEQARIKNQFSKAQELKTLSESMSAKSASLVEEAKLIQERMRAGEFVADAHKRANVYYWSKRVRHVEHEEMMLADAVDLKRESILASQSKGKIALKVVRKAGGLLIFLDGASRAYLWLATSVSPQLIAGDALIEWLQK